jgi:hypothetical protein
MSIDFISMILGDTSRWVTFGDADVYNPEMRTRNESNNAYIETVIHVAN